MLAILASPSVMRRGLNCILKPLNLKSPSFIKLILTFASIQLCLVCHDIGTFMSELYALSVSCNMLFFCPWHICFMWHCIGVGQGYWMWGFGQEVWHMQWQHSYTLHGHMKSHDHMTEIKEVINVWEMPVSLSLFCQPTLHSWAGFTSHAGMGVI